MRAQRYAERDNRHSLFSISRDPHARAPFFAPVHHTTISIKIAFARERTSLHSPLLEESYGIHFPPHTYMLKFSGRLLLSQDTLHRDLFQWYVKMLKCIYRLRTRHIIFITRPPWGRILVGGHDFTARQGKDHMRFPRAKISVSVRCTIKWV